MLPTEFIGGGPPEPTGFTVDDTVQMKTALNRIVAQVERAYLHRILQRHQGHLSQTAKAAGITRRTLYSKMKTYQLAATDYRNES